MKKKFSFGKFFILGFLLVIFLLISGFAGADNSGCCALTCKQGIENDCVGFFEAGKECSEIEQCNIGCCVDGEGYCLSNYLKGNCRRLNGRFISKKECRQYPHCLRLPSEGSLRGYTGFPFILKSEDKGISSVIPISGERGDAFRIKMVVFEYEDIDRVEAIIDNDRFQLYNDGAHEDGNEDDTIFANWWDSSQAANFNGIKNMGVDINIYEDGGYGNITNSTLYFTLIDNTTCLPIFQVWQNNTNKKNIVFTGYGYRDSIIKNELRKDARSIIGALLSSNHFINELENLNFYIILKNMTQKELSYVRNYISNECSLYNDLEDYIILFDKNQLRCRQQGRFITTNPVMYFDGDEIERIQNFDYLINNFCSYMHTEEEIKERARLRFEEPNITITRPLNGSVFDTDEIEIGFIIKDSKDNELGYEIYVDASFSETLYAGGTAMNNIEKIEILKNIPDGEHDLWVEAADIDGNLAFSDAVKIYVNVADFVINVTSPTKMAYNESPLIEFSISHAYEQSVNYSVFIKNESGLIGNGSFADGSTEINKVVSLETDLEEGHYKIKINATDSENRTAKSVPALIYIDKQKPILDILTANNSQSSNITFKAGDNMDDYLMYEVYVGTEEKETGFIDVNLPKTVQLTGLPNVVTVTVVDFAGNRDTKVVFLTSFAMLSPTLLAVLSTAEIRYDAALSIFLLIILALLISIMIMFYYKK